MRAVAIGCDNSTDNKGAKESHQVARARVFSVFVGFVSQGLVLVLGRTLLDTVGLKRRVKFFSMLQIQAEKP